MSTLTAIAERKIPCTIEADIAPKSLRRLSKKQILSSLKEARNGKYINSGEALKQLSAKYEL